MQRVPILGLAAVVVAVAACGSTTSSAPGATSSLAAGPSALPFADLMSGGSASAHGRAGTYRTRQFRPELTFTVPDGWKPGQILQTFVGADESASGIALTDGTGVIVVTVPSSIYPPAPGDRGQAVPADLVAALEADPNLALGAPTPISIGGLAGRSADGTVKATVDTGEDSGYRISDYLLVKPGDHVRFAVFKIGAAPVVVMEASTEAAWGTFSTTADAVVASMRFAQ